jgi:hypothetical protein
LTETAPLISPHSNGIVKLATASSSDPGAAVILGAAGERENYSLKVNLLLICCK